jgi:MtfA peptidase
MIYIITAIIVLIVLAFLIFRKSEKQPYVFSSIDIHAFLTGNVLFYSKLNSKQQQKFVERMKNFLGRVKITGIKTEVTEEDKALVAAAAIIPIFNFDNWFYPQLDEVLLYPSAFDLNFDLESDGMAVQGMVGNAFLNGKMLLSKASLHTGFLNKTDKVNTAIHEFVHLIDMADGATDGVPELFMNETNVLPWLDLMYIKIKEIEEGKSDINEYGTTDEAEFLSVAAEYFFERPDLLKRKHPRLFEMMQNIFGKK